MRTAYKIQFPCANSLPREEFRKIWDAWAPTKVQAFGWRLLLGRLPTLDNLIKRGVALNGSPNICYFCRSHEETVPHLFFGCILSYYVWQASLKWLGVSSTLPVSRASHFLLFESWGGSKVKDKVWRSFWLACTWNIWLHKNALAFRGGQPDLIKVFEGAKAHAWFWVKHLGKGLDGSFADWSREPRGCLHGFRGI